MRQVAAAMPPGVANGPGSAIRQNGLFAFADLAIGVPVGNASTFSHIPVRRFVDGRSVLGSGLGFVHRSLKCPAECLMKQRFS